MLRCYGEIEAHATGSCATFECICLADALLSGGHGSWNAIRSVTLLHQELLMQNLFRSTNATVVSRLSPICGQLGSRPTD
jgi:hypothetical protein